MQASFTLTHCENRYICPMPIRKIILYLLLLLPYCAAGQFYTGHQMNFGKNRVQYGDFYWQYRRQPDFDVYFSTGGKQLSDYVIGAVPGEVEKMERLLGHRYNGRIIFVIYNSLTDLRQSNIGLNQSDDQYNIGGTRLIVSNRVLLYFDGDHNALRRQIREGAASLILRDILHGGGGYKEALNSASTKEYPAWFLQGLESYAADPYNLFVEEQLRILLFGGKLQNYNRLSDENAIVGGHALWKYIYDVHGQNAASTIISLSRITRNVEQSFTFVLGIPAQQLIDDMNEYYRAQYRSLPDTAHVLSVKPLMKRQRKSRVSYSQCLSPTGDSVIYAADIMGRMKIELYSFSQGKKTVLRRWGHRLERIPDRTYPVFAWHPEGAAVSVFYEYEGQCWCALYVFAEDKWDVRPMHGFEKILSAEYSPNGKQYVLSAVKNGQSDIYLFNISQRTARSITDDIADDVSPRWAEHGETILFSSNRLPADSAVGPFMQMYKITSLQSLPQISPVVSVDNANCFASNTESTSSIDYLSDKSGVVNLYRLTSDSAIGSIDTAVHYRYSYQHRALTASIRHLRGNAMRGNAVYVIRNDGRYQFLGTHQLPIPSDSVPQMTFFCRNSLDALKADSLFRVNVGQLRKMREEMERERLLRDTLDIDNYVFLPEAYPSAFYDSVFGIDLPVDSSDVPSVYRTSFYINSVVNQIDFGFLNESYQNFTGGAVYYSPGMNIYFKMGVIDLFEDYRLTAGFRFSGNFDSNEYLFTIENLKKRLDKKLIFHRQAQLEYYPDNVNKVHGHEIKYALTYPFSEVSALRLMPSLRWDRVTRLAIVNTDLRVPAEQRYRAGTKLEYVFDNTFRKGLNLYNGIRTKVFAEYYQLLNNSRGNTLVLGADYRHYIKLFRSSIFAYRFATSTSLGNEMLLYYMGGVDNWINIFSNYPIYNESVEYDQSKNWAYQTIATNMRGFNQNVLNGNSFALANAEIRLPVVKMIAQRPISSEFLSNFQVITFCDAGAAWTGVVPKAKNNAYNYRVVQNGPVTVTIDQQSDPYVAGFGWGLRSRVFGYFIRADWAWGVQNSMVRPRIFYLSMSLDF